MDLSPYFNDEYLLPCHWYSDSILRFAYFYFFQNQGFYVECYAMFGGTRRGIRSLR